MPANQEHLRYPRIPVAPKNNSTTQPQKTQKLSPLGKIKLALQIRKLINQIRTMNITSSWRSSLFGVGGLGTILFHIVPMLLDGNPATNPDWGITLPALVTSIGLLFTKDAVVTHAPHPLDKAEKAN